MKSLSDAGVTTSESQCLLNAITRAGDRYRVKYKEGTQIMDCIFYWDPSDVQLTRRFSQVIQIDTTFKDNTWKYPLLEITTTTNEMNTILIESFGGMKSSSCRRRKGRNQKKKKEKKREREREKSSSQN